MRLKNLKVGWRLWLGFGLMILLMMISTGLYYVESRTRDVMIDELYEHEFYCVELMWKIENQINLLCQGITTIINETDRAEMESSLRNIEAAHTAYREYLGKLQEAEKDQKSLLLLQRLDETIKAARDLNNRVVELAMSGKREEARLLYIERGSDYKKQLDSMIGEIISRYEQEVAQVVAEMEKVGRKNMLLQLFLSLLFVLASAGIAFLITRSVSRPVQE
ncbi:MAG: MCP four helix bundle domain-containing protein, partial [Firmicutes bacterium]|nr:MCP four helix bundle domain-containing protein [Bacillota bacterium]